MKKTAPSIFISLLVLVSAVVVVFRGVPFLGFVNFDDPVAVLRPELQGGLTGEALRFALTEAPAHLWHPLTFLSHALDFEIFGDWAGGHHLTSVFFHLATAILLLFWLRRETGDGVKALVVAVLFAIHPLRVESVVWISERKDVLSVFFISLVVVFYSLWAGGGRERKAFYYGLAVLSGIGGLLSKPSLMVLPGLLLLVDFWPLQRFPLEDWRNAKVWWRKIREKLPFVVLAAVAAIIAWRTWSGEQQFTEAGDLGFPSRVGFASLAYLSYLGRTFWPTELVAFQSYPLTLSPFLLAAAFAVVVSISIVAFKSRRNRPWITVGWFWLLGAILPGSGIVTISDHFAPDRYTYLAHFGFLAGLVWFLWELGRKTGIPARVGWMVFAGVVAVLGHLSHRQTLTWTDSESLWSHALEAKGANHLVQNQLAMTRFSRGEVDEGLKLLRDAVDAFPDQPIPKLNLAMALGRSGRLVEAVETFRSTAGGIEGKKALRLQLIRLCTAAGKNDLAADLWRDLVREEPADMSGLLGAADFFFGQGDQDEATRLYGEAARLDPGNYHATLSLGAMLVRKGNLSAAMEWLERSIDNAREPQTKAEAHRTLAQAQLLGKNWRAAVESYEMGLELNPDRDLLRNELAQLLLDCPDVGVRNPRKALEIAEPLLKGESDSSGNLNPRFLRTISRAQFTGGEQAEAKKTAAAGLRAVAAIRARKPLEAPWTEKELDDLERTFRTIQESEIR